MGKALLFATVFALTGCATHVGYRAYDRDHHDYHAWGPNETVYYNQWTVESHRPQRDYRKMNRHDQDEYWKWRHQHQDHH